MGWVDGYKNVEAAGMVAAYPGFREWLQARLLNREADADNRAEDTEADRETVASDS